MKHNKVFVPIILAALAITAFSCKDKPVTPGPGTEEQELITTVTLVFTDSADNSVRRATFRDPDGEGGNPPVQYDTIRLKANHSYRCDILMLDESKSPADTVSNEVRERENDHEFFFHTHDISIGFQYLDFDTNSPALPVGLNTIWRTGSAGSGHAHVILKHQPGVKDGTASPGETDVDLEFECILE